MEPEGSLRRLKEHPDLPISWARSKQSTHPPVHRGFLPRKCYALHYKPLSELQKHVVEPAI